MCSIEGCSNKVHAKGLCNYHYNVTGDRYFRLKEIRKKYSNTEKGKLSKKKSVQKRRAKRSNSKVVEGNFSYQDIFSKHYYVCSICGLPINPLLRYPDKHAATLEHGVALSKGGEHTIENCSPAHFICNMRKGAKNIQPSFGGENI